MAAAALSDRQPFASEPLTPLVRQLASQLRATRSGSAVARSFPGRELDARPELRPTIEAIAKAADENLARQEAVELLKRRLDENEARLAVQAQQLADTEGKLRSASDEARRERARSEDLERRSAELLEKTQAMLADASERLHQAEGRAAAAESDLAFLKAFVQDRLSFAA